MPVKSIARPKGKPDTKHAYKDEDSNSIWLAEFEWREPGVPGAPLVVVVQIEGEDGVKEEGTISHTFTEEQLAQPDFDPDAFVEQIVAERVTRAVNIRANRNRIKSFQAKRKPKGNN
jgi:hypothetical protein